MNDHGAPEPGEVESQPVMPAAQQILDTFGRARPMSVGNAGQVPGSTVKVTGHAVPGPSGPLRAPLSGAECVWYRSVIMKHQRATRNYPSPPLEPFASIAPSDLPQFATRLAVPSQRRWSDRSSTSAFGVDDGTGVLAIDPTQSDVDTDVFAINAVVTVSDPNRETNVLGFGGGPFDNQELHTEWIIPVGAPLLAVGNVGTGSGVATLASSAQDVALVSTKPEQQVLSRNRAAADPAGPHAPFRRPSQVYLVVGGFTAFGLILAIILVVLFVVPH